MAPRAPRFDDVRPEEHIALLPAGATLRGFFVTDTIDRARAVAPSADVHAIAGVEARRYLPFLGYPYGDYLRVLHAAAGIVHPELPRGEALRRLGWSTYEVFEKTRVGSVIFGMLGREVEPVLLSAARAYGVGLSFGKVSAEKLGARHVRVSFRGMPGFLETSQVGVVEGAVKACGHEPDVEIDLHDLASADLDVRWR